MRRIGTGRTAEAVAAMALFIPCGMAAQETAERRREPQRIIVSIPDRKLALVDSTGRVLKTYEVAVGAPVSPTPTGTFEVVNRVANPTYYHSGKLIPAGKGNPVGTRWMGLSKKSFGIHGTNVPRSIGRAASHGCVRLRNRDVEELFELVRTGDIVELRAERDEFISQLFAAAPADAALAVAGSAE